MMGAVIGDIAGSVYEWNNIKTKEFELFSPKCFFTDDTVMTFAVAQALLDGGKKADYVSAMQRLGRRYPGREYGGNFACWLKKENPRPYGSWGNGSAMRVSPVAWVYETLRQVERAAAKSARVTHNHPEGIKGAKATAAAIFMARKGKNKEEIRRYIQRKYGYNLNRTLDQIRPGYSFNESCRGTVPEAIIAYLESTGFEDAIRNAVSLGGDSDTLAAITGSIAEGEYGIPDAIRNRAWSVLPPELREIYRGFEEAFGCCEAFCR